MRFGFNALCTTHRELLTAARRLQDIAAGAAYDPTPPKSGPVT
jgi:kynureninase